MATTNRIINADVSVDGSYIYELSKQYDHLSRKYRVLITDHGVPIKLTGNEGILFRMQVAGETDPYVLHWIKEWENGYPVVEMTNHMLSKVGVVHYEFVIYDEPGGSAVLSTRQQNMKIQKSLLNYDGLIASEDFDILSDLINQARAIPDLINDFNLAKEEVDVLITKLHTDILNYQSQFTTLQNNVADLIQSAETYIQQLTIDVKNTFNQAKTALSTAKQLIATADNTLSQANQKAAESLTYALEAKRYTVGGVIPEDTEDNAKWYYQQTQSLKEQVEASAKIHVPKFWIDFTTGKLMSSTEAKGMHFWIEDGKFFGEETA